jgi:hypothetical protein
MLLAFLLFVTMTHISHAKPDLLTSTRSSYAEINLFDQNTFHPSENNDLTTMHTSHAENQRFHHST